MGARWMRRTVTLLTPTTRHASSSLFPGFPLWLGGVLIAILISQPALAGRQDCFAISDRDQRHLCLADCDGKGTCTLIEDQELANYCRATHGDGKGTCVLIEDEELRARCRAKVP